MERREQENRRGKSPAKQPTEEPGRPAVQSEPQMRRWQHPVEEEESPAWQYLCQAAAYQNQLLSEIKVLLEKLNLK